MKKMRLPLFLICLVLAQSPVRAQSIAHYFTQMPAPLIPGISLDTRKDLIDFYKNGKLAVMPAAFGGKVELKVLTDDYLSLQTSGNADLQIKILRLSDTLRVLAVVGSATAPLKNSRMMFYTTNWKPFDGLLFPEMSVQDFLNADKARELGVTDRLPEIGPRLFVSLAFESEGARLVARSSLREDLTTEQLGVLGPVVRDSIVYRLENNRFIPE
jgi:hypothetical protein